MAEPEPLSPEKRPSSPTNWLFGVLVLLTLLGGGIAAYIYWPSKTERPSPPSIPTGLNEPKLTAVLTRLRQRVLSNPDSAEAWGDLGMAFLANELESEAFDCFEVAQRLAPDNPRWPYYRAGVYLNRGDLEAARAEFQTAVERSNSSDTVPHLFLAETLMNLGRTSEAERLFLEVNRRTPTEIRTKFGQGILAMTRQEWRSAREHLLRCLADPRSRKKATLHLATVSLRLEDTEASQNYREQARTLPEDLPWSDPWVADYLVWGVKKRSKYKRAEQLEAEGRFREVVALATEMTKDDPNDHIAHFLLGKNLSRLGECSRAERALREALTLAPDKAQLTYYLALTLLLHGQQLESAHAGDKQGAKKYFEQACVSANDALRQVPHNGFAYMVLGLALEGLGKTEEAVEALGRAVECNPELGELHFHLGRVLRSAGKKKEARERLQRAIEFAPQNASWLEEARQASKHLDD